MKAVVLAAGKGTRLHPITLTRPKHLVPVGGKPIIDHVLAVLKGAGMTEVLFVVHYKAELLKEHLGHGQKYGMDFEFALQKQLKGTADAARVAEPYVNGEFFLTYADWLITEDAIRKVIKVHKKEKPKATMAVVPVQDPEHYGIVQLENSFVKGIFEKPQRGKAPSNLANAGTYILSDEIFQAIDRTKPSPRGELEITDSLSLLLRREGGIAAASISSTELFDVGLLWDLLGANRWILRRMSNR